MHCHLLLQTKLLCKKVVCQRPHVSALTVVGSSAVSSFGVFIGKDFRSLLRAGLLHEGCHHLARVPGVDPIISGARGEQHARALPIGIARFCGVSKNIVVTELELAENVMSK